METAEKTLVPTKKYLQTGAHIGARFKTYGMKKFIFKKRKDGLKVLEIEKIDEKIRAAAKLLSNYKPKDIIVVSRKQYGQTPAKKLAEAIGARALTARFVPGTFTNPEGKEFLEPKVLISIDSDVDQQAVKEATKIRIPVISLCSTNNATENIDLIIPINNNGRQSLALACWLIAKEYLKNTGAIKKDDDFKESPESFEHKVKDEKEQPEAGKEEAAEEDLE